MVGTLLNLHVQAILWIKQVSVDYFKINKIDKRRAQTRALITDSDWGDRSAYHLILNTTNWDLKELALAVSEFVKLWFEKNNK